MLKDKEQIKQWLDSMKIENYTINEDLTVDVDSGVKLSDNDLTNIPVQFGIVKGNFSCGTNKLTSLQGCPQSVDGDFVCNNNLLTRLQDCPQSIRGHFNCGNNKLTSLEGGPQFVGGHFICFSNKLTSLENCPKSIGGHFNCGNNKLTSLQDCPQSVVGNFDCNNNPIKNIDLNTFDTNFNGTFYHKGSMIEQFFDLYIEGELKLTYKDIENIKLNNKLNDIIKDKTETINTVNKHKL